MMDLDNYIETQSKVLTSETLALQTIRNSGLAGTSRILQRQRSFRSHRHRARLPTRNARRKSLLFSAVSASSAFPTAV